LSIPMMFPLCHNQILKVFLSSSQNVPLNVRNNTSFLSHIAMVQLLWI
jgi:hypothetical protein